MQLSYTIRDTGIFYESRITDDQSAEQTGAAGRPNHGGPHSVCDNLLSLSNNAELYWRSSLTLSKDHLCCYFVISCMPS